MCSNCGWDQDYELPEDQTDLPEMDDANNPPEMTGCQLYGHSYQSYGIGEYFCVDCGESYSDADNVQSDE